MKKLIVLASVMFLTGLLFAESYYVYTRMEGESLAIGCFTTDEKITKQFLKDNDYRDIFIIKDLDTKKHTGNYRFTFLYFQDGKLLVSNSGTVKLKNQVIDYDYIQKLHKEIDKKMGYTCVITDWRKED